MSKATDVLKLEYNRVLERERKAEEFLDHATPEQAKKWLPEFHKIVMQLSALMERFKVVAGREMTHEEIVYGFGGEKKDGKV